MNQIIRKKFTNEHVATELSLLEVNAGTREMHLLIQPDGGYNTHEAWQLAIDELVIREKQFGFSENCRFFLRVFLNDAANQEKILREHFPNFFDLSKKSKVSIVQQPPLPDSKLSVWAYLVQGENPVNSTDHGTVFQSNGLSHIWTTNLVGCESSNVFGQTNELFQKYIDILKQHNANLKDQAVRTWLFVRDIDNNYMDVVRSREQVFQKNGLKKKTHYIASTGIEGECENSDHAVFMDAYTIAGLVPDQVSYLNAPSNMCPTHDYGVTFERGTVVAYGDRKHVFISGTASINNRGEVLYEGNVEAQTKRVIENIQVLLAEAGCQLSDLASVLVYIRNQDDYSMVQKLVSELLPNIPALILLAPVCRPTWLVEIEGIAVKVEKANLPDF